MMEVIFAKKRGHVYRNYGDFDSLFHTFGFGNTRLGVYSEFGGTVYCSVLRNVHHLTVSMSDIRVITVEEGTYRLYVRGEGSDRFIVWTVFAYEADLDIKDGVKDKIDFSFDTKKGFNVDSGSRIVEIAERAI